MANPAKFARELRLFLFLFIASALFVFEPLAVASSIRIWILHRVAGLRAMSPGFDADNGAVPCCQLLLVASGLRTVQEGAIAGYKPLGIGWGTFGLRTFPRRTSGTLVEWRL